MVGVMTMFDELDSLTAEQREHRLFSDFSGRLRQCVQRLPGLAEHLAGQTLDAINDRAALQQLPVLRKQALMQAQQARPPFGGFVDIDALSGTRVFMSPGPVWEPQLSYADPWQSARALHAAGIRRGDRVHNTFSYHTTPGGFILDEGARALGCVVFPAGVGGTDTQVQAVRHLQASVYVGTPDYLQIMLDHAKEAGSPLSTLKRAMVSGGALFPAMRRRYQEQGIHIQQCYATADLGVVAYETATDDTVHAGMLVNENLIVEIVVPGTGTPVSPGDVGEVLVTRLDPVYPLLRFATGDLSAQIMEPSPCGRSALRLKGWLGRADQRAKVRGLFIDPMQLHVLKTENPQIDRWRVTVSRESDRDVMHLQVTLDTTSDYAGAVAQTQRRESTGAMESALSDSLKRATNLNGTVTIVDTLPNDGIVIDDQREYEQE